MTRYIIWDKMRELWEEQYILRDLLEVDKDTYPYFIHTTPVLNYSSVEPWTRLSNIRDVIGHNIFIFSSIFDSYQCILNLVKYLQPKIIIHLSDELGDSPQYQELSRYTMVLLRQYHHLSYHRQYQLKYVVKPFLVPLRRHR